MQHLGTISDTVVRARKHFLVMQKFSFVTQLGFPLPTTLWNCSFNDDMISYFPNSRVLSHSSADWRLAFTSSLKPRCEDTKGISELPLSHAISPGPRLCLSPLHQPIPNKTPSSSCRSPQSGKDDSEEWFWRVSPTEGRAHSQCLINCTQSKGSHHIQMLAKVWLERMVP